MSSIYTPPLDDNNVSSPLTNRIDEASLPVYKNPVALIFALNVFESSIYYSIDFST